MGHAGALVSGANDTAAAKIDAMKRARIAVSPTPAAMGRTLLGILKG
jgi:succinyl-CoA synthetase alpha subunit